MECRTATQDAGDGGVHATNRRIASHADRLMHSSSHTGFPVAKRWDNFVYCSGKMDDAKSHRIFEQKLGVICKVPVNARP